MQHSTPELEDLKAATGIRDFQNVTTEQFAGVVTKAAQYGLTVPQLTLLAQVMPAFLQLQEKVITDLLGGVRQVSEEAGRSQRAALEAVGRSLESILQTFHVLAQNAQTDEVRGELARQIPEVGRIGLEYARIIQSMNESNNGFWGRMGHGLLNGVLVVLGVAAVAVVGVAAVFLKAAAEATAKAAANSGQSGANQTSEASHKPPKRSRRA